jgi:hypothetical protein
LLSMKNNYLRYRVEGSLSKILTDALIVIHAKTQVPSKKD